MRLAIERLQVGYGLPLLVNYQEQNYLITFAIIVEDSITGTDTLSLGVLDLAVVEDHRAGQSVGSRARSAGWARRARNWGG